MTMKPSCQGGSRKEGDQECVPAQREEQKVVKITKSFQALSRQTDKSIHAISVTTVKEMERTWVARAKEKERTKKTVQSLFKELRKESRGIRLKAASSTGDQANASPGAYEATTPDRHEWHEDSYYADQGWSYATYEQQSYSYAAFASCRKTWKKKTKGRTKGSKGRGADPSPRMNPVGNSCESYHSLTPVTTGQEYRNTYCHSSCADAAKCAVCFYRTDPS